MPPDGATIVIDIPEAELLPYEALGEGWEATASGTPGSATAN